MVAEIAAVVEAFPDVPLLFNYAEGGKTPAVSYARICELGFRIVIFAISTLLAATEAMRAVLARGCEEGTPQSMLPDLPKFTEFTSSIGLPEITELEKRFGQE